MNTPKPNTHFDIRKYFTRGESLVATTGMAFVAILTFAVGGVVWVSAKTIDDSVYAQQETQIKETTAFIASQAELRLNANDISGLRRLMLDSVASGMVEICEVSLSGVGVIASSDASKNLLSEVPESWVTTVQVPQGVVHDQESHRAIVQEPLIVDGESGMVLEVVIHREQKMLGSDTIRVSSVGIVSVGLFLMLFVYRRFRNRLGALAGIGDALVAAGSGERRLECLLVGEQLGPQAVTWNTLLSEREAIEHAIVEQEIVQSFGNGMVESFGLPAACNTLTQGIMLLESDLRVLYANGAACVFLRTLHSDLIDATLEKVPNSDQMIETIQSVLSEQGNARKVIEVGDVKNIELEGAVLRVIVTKVHEDGIDRAMVFIEDVTQQRLADQSQSAFIAQATHELRTPLTTIRLYAEEAVEAGSGDEQIREKALNVITSETRRLERIVGDMLCVAEIEAGSLSIRVDNLRTEQLFGELEEDYQAQSKDKAIEMVFDLPPKFPSIRADRDRLGQALHNLVGNAIKYTPSGGRVEVKVKFEENNTMVVQVIDSGIGIDESQHERIFDRFCRADDRRIAQVTGSGLGLALARQIARLHNGDVTVESEIDKGSTFTLTIPGVEEMSKAA